MDNFDLKKYLAEGKLFEQEYPELISFLNANVEDVKQHMRDEFLDDEDEIEYASKIPIPNFQMPNESLINFD